MTVREFILSELTDGFVEKDVLIDGVVNRLSVTPQAVYKEIRKLVSDDVIINKNKRIGLTLWYIEDQVNTWNQSLEKYTKRISMRGVLDLPKGKSLNLEFKNLKELDTYWTQSFIVLEKLISESFPTYTIVPHDWFYYSKNKSDSYWTHKQSDRKQRLLITHPFDIDREVIREGRKSTYQYTIGENPLKQNETKYYTLISDWVFEVDLDKDVNEMLTAYISKLGKLNQVDIIEINNILEKRGNFKIKIKHSPVLAAKLTKKVIKYFE